MTDPFCPQDHVRLLGMMTYLDKFCPHLATFTRPLRDLLKGNAAFVKENQHKAALTKLKTVMSSLPVLRLFDSSLPAVVSVDATSIGIAAVLLQSVQPVAFASTSLTDTQKRYFLSSKGK